MLLMALPALAAAAQPELCPWLNAATAGGVLGGAVANVAVKRAKTGDDASCVFVRASPSLAEFRIDVETMPDPAKDFASYQARCRSAAVPLRAIGNQAAACDDAGAALVVGRVRDRAFIVRISAGGPSAPSGALRDKARNIAEQVAGILF